MIDKKAGFTLSELIIVIAVLAILATVLIPLLSGYVQRAQEGADTANARLLYLSTAMLISANQIHDGTYTVNEQGRVPYVFQEYIGPSWPIAKNGNQPFSVIVELSSSSANPIQVIRHINAIQQVYQVGDGCFK